VPGKRAEHLGTETRKANREGNNSGTTRYNTVHNTVQRTTSADQGTESGGGGLTAVRGITVPHAALTAFYPPPTHTTTRHTTTINHHPTILSSPRVLRTARRATPRSLMPCT
jgi:hypothetical protein